MFKSSELYDYLLLLLPSMFHVFYFICSPSISFSLCSPISPFLFLMYFLKHLSSIVEKLYYTYVHMYYTEGKERDLWVCEYST